MASPSDSMEPTKPVHHPTYERLITKIFVGEDGPSSQRRRLSTLHLMTIRAVFRRQFVPKYHLPPNWAKMLYRRLREMEKAGTIASCGDRRMHFRLIQSKASRTRGMALSPMSSKRGEKGKPLSTKDKRLQGEGLSMFSDEQQFDPILSPPPSSFGLQPATEVDQVEELRRQKGRIEEILSALSKEPVVSSWGDDVADMVDVADTADVTDAADVTDTANATDMAGIAIQQDHQKSAPAPAPTPTPTLNMNLTLTLTLKDQVDKLQQELLSQRLEKEQIEMRMASLCKENALMATVNENATRPLKLEIEQIKSDFRSQLAEQSRLSEKQRHDMEQEFQNKVQELSAKISAVQEENLDLFAELLKTQELHDQLTRQNALYRNSMLELEKESHKLIHETKFFSSQLSENEQHRQHILVQKTRKRADLLDELYKKMRDLNSHHELEIDRLECQFNIKTVEKEKLLAERSKCLQDQAELLINRLSNLPLTDPAPHEMGAPIFVDNSSKE